MRPSALALFGVLAREAIGDATRRRIVPMIALVALISLLGVDTCTSCAEGSSVIAGNRHVSLSELGGWTGMLIFTLLSLWTMVLAGLLASDHLAEPIFDGSANLVLARPVRRSEFAAARLAGALAIAYALGAVVLTGSAVLLHLRNDLPVLPAVWAGLACAAGAFVVASIAMAISLAMTRVATALFVLIFVGAIAFINAFTLFNVTLGPVGTALQQFTPPLCTAVVVALSAWTYPVVPNVDPNIMALKLLTWMIVSAMLLLAAFRRVELGR